MPLHVPALLALALCAHAADSGAPEATASDKIPTMPTMQVRLPAFDLQTKVFDFPTGLRVMFQSDRSYPIVSVYMIVAHGSADDPADKKEVAHFVEHTWFRSVHGDLPPIMDVVNDMSGVFNASTWNDWTNYSTVANSEFLPSMLKLESLRLTEFYKGMTAENTDTEREVIRNEWRRRNENNMALLFDYMSNVAFPEDHPYHSTSTHETIDNIQLADLQAYVDKYYKPEETTIMVVGDFDPDRAGSLIFENFDLKLLHPKLTPAMLVNAPVPGVENPDPKNPNDWMLWAYDPDEFLNGKKAPFQFVPIENIKPRVTEDRPGVPELGNKELVVREAPVDYPMALVGWTLPGGFREDHIQLEALGQYSNLIVGQVRGLYPEKTFGDENSGCFVQAEVVNSTLMCLMEVKSSKVDAEDVVDKMIDQTYQLWTRPDAADAISIEYLRASLARTQNDLLASQLYSIDTIASVFGGRADAIGTFAHLTSNPNYFEHALDQFSNINIDGLMEMSERYLTRPRAARLVVNPLPEDEIDTTSAESGYVGESKNDTVTRATDDLTQVTAESVVAARKVPDVTKIVDQTLPNGLRVVVLPHGEAPTVQASLIFGGGTYSFPKGQTNFLGFFTEGAGQDPLRFAAESSYFFFAGIPGILEATSWPLALGWYGNALRVSLSAPAGNLDSTLWTMRKEIEELRPSLSGSYDWKLDRFKKLKAHWGDETWHVADYAERHLFPDAQWQQEWTWEEAEAAKEFGTGTVTGMLDQMIEPKNTVLLIVGNIDGKEAIDLATRYFGGWAGRTSEGGGWVGDIHKPAMPQEPTRVLLFDDPKKTQTQTDLSCRLNYTGEKDRAAVSVLGSSLSSRTFNTLRVQEALSYSPYAYASISDDDAAVLTFSSLALNKGVGRTVEFFLQATREVTKGDIDPLEVTQHKLRTARESGVMSQSIDQMASTLTTVIRRGDSWDTLRDAGKYIAEVDKDQIVRLIQGCEDHAVITMLGPVDVIKPQLDERGIKYEVIDWEKRGEDLLAKYDPKAYKKKMKDKAKEEAKKAKETPVGDAPTTPAG